MSPEPYHLRSAWRLASPGGEIVLRRACRGDLSALHELLETVGAWLRSQGIEQWPEGRFPKEILWNAIRQGEVFLAYEGEALIGTLSLQGSDPLVWGEGSEEGLYLYRLAVHPEFRGGGIGSLLLGWSERMAASEGKRYLRLDCWAENPALHRFYEKAGFVFIRWLDGPAAEKVYRKGWAARLYEKEVSQSSDIAFCL